MWFKRLRALFPTDANPIALSATLTGTFQVRCQSPPDRKGSSHMCLILEDFWPLAPARGLESHASLVESQRAICPESAIPILVGTSGLVLIHSAHAQECLSMGFCTGMLLIHERFCTNKVTTITPCQLQVLVCATSLVALFICSEE